MNNEQKAEHNYKKFKGVTKEKIFEWEYIVKEKMKKEGKKKTIITTLYKRVDEIVSPFKND